MGFFTLDTFLKVIERLEFIREMDLGSISLHTIHRNRLTQLARLGTRSNCIFLSNGIVFKIEKNKIGIDYHSNYKQNTKFLIMISFHV